MVFRRRTPISFLRMLRNLAFPPGGWRRSFTYMRLRLTRIPDEPVRIARGIAFGIFASFTPLFGLHFFLAAALALVLRGNLIAAMIGTAAGNPLTFPFIAVLSLDLGRAILNTGDGVPFSQIMTAFGQAGDEIVRNFLAIFTSDVLQWGKLSSFLSGVFLPYLVGGLGPGLVAALAGYWLSLPTLGAYQKMRAAKREARFIKRAQDLADKPGAKESSE